MSEATQWDDVRYALEKAMYAEGEYDGYWHRPPRTGEYSNDVWAAYLRGFKAGQIERNEEPSDAQIDAWLRKIDGMDSEGNR